MNRPKVFLPTRSVRRRWCMLFAGVLVVIAAGHPHSAQAATFTVTKTADTNDGVCNADCSLREAIVAANANVDADTIIVPAGVYLLNLTPGSDENAAATGDLDLTGSVTINGAGAGSAIIDGGNADRVFDIAPLIACNCTISLSGLTIRNGKAFSTNANVGGGIYIGTGVTVNINNSVIADNQSQSSGGGGIQNGGSLTLSNVTMQNNSALGTGGAINNIGALTINTSSFLTNTAEAGGALYINTGAANGVNIAGSVFANNRAVATAGGAVDNGGAIAIDADGAVSITKSSFTSNSAAQNGGAIYLNDSATEAAVATMTLSFNRIAGNTATTAGSGLFRTTGTATAENNWWGCNAGPSAAPCDRVSGTADFDPWLRLTHAASPNPVFTGAGTTLTASFLTNSANGAVSASNLTALNGVAIAFNTAVLGAISNAQATIQSGTATATFTAGGTAGAGAANATVDSQTVTANITIQTPPDTTPPDTTITSNPSNPSNSASATFSFTGSDPGGSGVASFQCQLDGAGGFSACTSPRTYTGLADGSRTFQVRAIDAASNTDPTPASFTWVIDTTAPTVTINQAAGQADPTGAGPINFTVVFNEAVSGFGNSDVTLGGTAGANTAVVTGGPSTYNVAVSGMTGSGTVTATIAASRAADAAGNGNSAATSTDNSVTYEALRPDVAITKTALPDIVTPGGAITYTLRFTNAGPGIASGVTISDSIPLSVTITGVTSSTVDSGVVITQTSGSPDFAWDVSDLAVGAGGVITLTGTISVSQPISLAGQIITNTAVITASGDITATNNSSSAAPHRLCGPGTYLDTTTNQCQPASPGKYVPDFGYTAATPCLEGTYQPNDGASSCLPAPINFFVALQESTAPDPCPVGTYSPVEGAVSCLNLSNGLSIRKTVDNPTPAEGATVTFTVAISNSSSLSLTNATLTDDLPAGLNFVAGSASLTPPDGGATLAATGANLPALAAGLTITDGAKITVTFQVTVGPGTAGSTLTNTVSLSSTQMSAPFTDTATVGVPLCFAESTGDNTTDFASVDAQAVQAAIDAASSGGTVKLAGTCTGVTTKESTNQTGYISKTLTLRGGYTPADWTTSDPVANPTTLDAAQDGRVLFITGAIDVAVQNLRLTGGSGDNGGGIFNTAATTAISNTQAYSNSATNGGGGIWNEASGSITLHASSVTSNTASSGDVNKRNGGGIHSSGAGSIVSLIGGSHVAHNIATGDGGGIFNIGQSAVTIDASSVVSNTSGADGGGVVNWQSSVLTVTNGSRIEDNRANRGGGVWNGTSSTAAIDQSQILSNTATGNGGGLYNEDSSYVTVTNSSLVQANQAGTGGGLFNTSASTVSLDDSRVLSNTATANGGGLYNQNSGSVITLTSGSLVQANNVGTHGGGIFNLGGSVSVNNSSIYSNSASASGGGIWNEGAGSVTLNASAVATNTGQLGGGIYNTDSGSTLALSNGSLLQDNRATNSGGGIYNNLGASVSLNSSKILSNGATNAGGGIYNSNVVTITNGSLIALNGAATGGGVWNTGRATVEGSSVLSNTATSGGGFYSVSSGQLTISASTVVSNSAADRGGGIAIAQAGSVLTLTNNSLVQDNVAGATGGGIDNWEAATRVESSRVYSNTAFRGGGIANDFGQLTVDASSVHFNTATDAGGGVWSNGGTVSLVSGTTVQSNGADVGGGLFNQTSSVMVLDASTVATNTAMTRGGGIGNAGGVVTVTNNSLLQANVVITTTGVGGGIANRAGGIVSVTGSRLLANQAPASGGALYQDSGSSSSVTASCVVNNSATAVTYASGIAPLTATGNWWGHFSGPSGAGPGTGDGVSSNVAFGGFLGAAILGCPTFADSDLIISKTGSTSSALPGAPITYTLTFTNSGPRFGSSVALSDSVPLSVTITGVASSTVGNGVAIAQTSGGPNFAWTVGDSNGDLAVGAGGTITLTGFLNPVASVIGAVITNTATITASSDVTPTNNSADAAITGSGVGVVCFATPGRWRHRLCQHRCAGRAACHRRGHCRRRGEAGRHVHRCDDHREHDPDRLHRQVA